jgi:O-antigen/teichoic acid export membrane protein
MHEYTRVLILLSLPIVGFVLLASDELVPLLTTGFYGNYYEPAVDVAPIVAVGTVLYVLALVANTGLVIAKRSRLILFGAGGALLANIVANLVLIPPFGIVGAGIATIIGMGVFLLVTLVTSRPFATWHFPLTTFLRGLAATLAGVGAALALGRLTDGDVGELLVSAGGGLVVYAAALVLLGELPPRRTAA